MQVLSAWRCDFTKKHGTVMQPISHEEKERKKKKNTSDSCMNKCNIGLTVGQIPSSYSVYEATSHAVPSTQAI